MEAMYPWKTQKPQNENRGSLVDGFVSLDNGPGAARLPRCLCGDLPRRAVSCLRQTVPQASIHSSLAFFAVICIRLSRLFCLFTPLTSPAARNQWGFQLHTSRRQQRAFRASVPESRAVQQLLEPVFSVSGEEGSFPPNQTRISAHTTRTRRRGVLEPAGASNDAMHHERTKLAELV